MRYIYAFLFALLVLSACKKDDQNMDPVPEPINTGDHFSGQTISADFSGTVTDESGSPVSGAMVHIGSSMTTTNGIGYFVIDNAQVDSKRAHILVEAVGYFSGGAIKSYPSSENRNSMSIRMQSRGFANTFNGSTGGTVSNADGLALDFPPSALVSSDGSPYAGTVNVYMHWLNPSESFDMLFIPGDLAALDENEAVVLKSYSMIAVELEDASGNALEVAAGKEVGIQFPLDPDLLGMAPSEIPLWHFDEQSGLWMNEGSALLNGDRYEGSVSHFTWWNCDVPASFVDLEICVVDQSGDPVLFLLLELVSDSSGSPIRDLGASNCNSGMIPQGENFVLNVFNGCGVIIHSEILGVISEDSELLITIDTSDLMTSLQGSIVDCEGITFTEGQLFITTSSNSYSSAYISPIGTDGVFSLSGTWCGNIVNLFYVLGNQFIDIGEYNLQEGQNYDLGSLSLCDEEFEFFDFTIADSTYIITEFNFDIIGNNIVVTSLNSSDLFFEICILGDEIGTYVLCSISFYFYEPTYGECETITAQEATILESPANGSDFVHFQMEGTAVGEGVQVPFAIDARLQYN